MTGSTRRGRNHQENRNEEENTRKEYARSASAATGLGPGRFHSFAIGLGCHNEFHPVFVVVRAGEVVDRFASSLYLVTMRIGHLPETAAAQCFPRLSCCLLRLGALIGEGHSTASGPQKLPARRSREVHRIFCRKSKGPYSSNRQPRLTAGFILCRCAMRH